MLFRNAKVVLPDAVAENCSVLIRGNRIAAVGAEIKGSAEDQIINATGYYLAPGFIDLHMHIGYLGPDFPPQRELQLCAVNLPANGTTRFLPTLISALKGNLSEYFEAIRSFLGVNPVGTKPIGVHLEGPYINVEARGGFLPSQITTPTQFCIKSILDAGSDLIRLVTLSPELPATTAVIQDCVSRNIVVAMGHSYAGMEEYQAGRVAGATHCAHTYNNRRTFPDSPMGGRGFTLDDLAVADDEVTCELICDGTHVKPVWIKTIYRTKGADGICLITDSFLAGRRSAEGEIFQTAGSQKLIVRNGVGRDEEGKLAGSVLTQDRAVKNFVALSGATLPEAIRCASLNPARVIGMSDRFGSIEVGKQADLVLLDARLTPVMTIVDGQVAYDVRSGNGSEKRYDTERYVREVQLS